RGALARSRLGADRQRGRMARHPAHDPGRRGRAGRALDRLADRRAVQRRLDGRVPRHHHGVVRLRLRRRRPCAPRPSQPALPAADRRGDRARRHARHRPAALRTHRGGRPRLGVALLSSGRALGRHRLGGAVDRAPVDAARLRASHGRRACGRLARLARAHPQVRLVLPASMLLALGLALLSGLPVAVVLIGVALLFASIALVTGAMRTEELGAIFHRLYGTLSDRDEVVYAAVPMLLFMGAVLHETGLAASLLSACARAFRRVRGGPALATLAVGAIQAPAAGMIGASTGALALYALPA